MATEKISAETRTEFGKGAARRIRRDHKIPAVVYGHGNETVHVALPGHDTMMALKHGGANALLELDIDGALLSTWSNDPWAGAAYSTSPAAELAETSEHPVGPLAFAGEHLGGAFAALMEGKTILDLAEGLQVRRARVMGVNRIELTGFSEPMRDRLRAYGLFGEIISWKLV